MTPRRSPRMMAAVFVSILVLLAALERGRCPAGQTKTDQPAGRAAVARCVTGTGSMIRREAPDKPWQIVKEGEVLHSGDLIVGLPGSALESNNGAVRLNLRSDLSGTTPFPIVETAVFLHDSKDVDLDFRLDRGRVEFVNRKDKGPARVRPRLREEGARGEVVLEPAAACALEIFGRWPAGVPFQKDAKPDHAPTLHVIFLVLKGEITLNIGAHHVAMKAPPGPALIEWDSVTGGDPTPRRLDQLPGWATEDDKSPKAEKRKAYLDQFRQLALKRSIEAALDEYLNSDDVNKRTVAINAMAAMDDLKRLAQAMSTSKHPDVWDSGVLALRHWIGRGPGQDQLLYQGLITEGNFKPVEAETALQLLHSYGDKELARPETYETLIDFLGHDRLAIRGLAYWHLVRLVPDGRKIGYDPLAAKEVRDKAIDQWHKLLPRGKLPPKPQPENP